MVAVVVAMVEAGFGGTVPVVAVCSVLIVSVFHLSPPQPIVRQL